MMAALHPAEGSEVHGLQENVSPKISTVPHKISDPPAQADETGSQLVGGGSKKSNQTCYVFGTELPEKAFRKPENLGPGAGFAGDFLGKAKFRVWSAGRPRGS